MIKAMDSKVVHSDPEIMHGTPVFMGTRVPAETLWHYLEAGDCLDDFLMDFPSVTQEQAVLLLQQARNKMLAGSTSKPIQSSEITVEAAP